MKLLNYNKVLCLSPHPDDVEYSMAGTILKFTDTTFISLQLCEGGDNDLTTNSSRLSEVKRVSNILNSSNFYIEFSNIPRIRLLREDEWIHFIEFYTTTFNVDAIFLPNSFDSHFEHRFVSGFGRPLTRSSPISLIEYKTPSTTQEWVPNLFIDISEQYIKKLEALKEFSSQQHRYYFREDVLQAFHSDFQSAKRGKHCVEQFRLIEIYQ